MPNPVIAAQAQGRIAWRKGLGESIAFFRVRTLSGNTSEGV